MSPVSLTRPCGPGTFPVDPDCPWGDPQAVPVTDRQLFFVSTDRQLTNTDDVTALLEDIRAAGGFSAVRSLDFQAINYGGQVTMAIRWLTCVRKSWCPAHNFQMSMVEMN